MRLFLCWLLLILFAAGCHIKETNNGYEKTDKEQAAILKDTANFTTIEWLDSVKKDFGKIAEGQRLEVLYRFKNTGDKPLVITRVQPGCGCTVAEQPTEPVLAGKIGTIKAVFNSEGHSGINRKTIFVFANTKGTTNNEVQFVVEVEKKKL